MKIPKNFIPEKNKTTKLIEELLNLPALISDENLELMLEGYEEFLENPYFLEANRIATKLNYSKYGLKLFCNQLINYKWHKYFQRTGMYLSELVCKIIQEDEKIILKLPDTKKKLDFLGANLRRGKLVIKGNGRYYTGAHMTGGYLIIQGSVEHSTGLHMRGGRMYANKIASISKLYESGEIYENKKRLRG